MFGIILDISSKKILYAESIYIEVLDVITQNAIKRKVFTGYSKEEMYSKVLELKEIYEEYEVICVKPQSNMLEH